MNWDATARAKAERLSKDLAETLLLAVGWIFDEADYDRLARNIVTATPRRALRDEQRSILRSQVLLFLRENDYDPDPEDMDRVIERYEGITLRACAA